MENVINYGARVIVIDAVGKRHTRIALSGVMMGEDFPIVWACRDDEFEAAQRDGRAPAGVPWPAGDVVIDPPA
jgi:hypothetical protein